MAGENLRGAVPLSHHFIRDRVRTGDRAVDATCGNGNDTLLLAELVGDPGKVWAFDIQQQAVDNTRRQLADAGLLERVELVTSGHELLSRHVSEPIKAAVFNLGYLPGGERSITTTPAATVSALDQAARLLTSGGVVIACIYTGHAGGDEEGEAVAAWGASLPPETYNVWTCRLVNRPPRAPYVVVVEKA